MVTIGIPKVTSTMLKQASKPQSLMSRRLNRILSNKKKKLRRNKKRKRGRTMINQRRKIRKPQGIRQ